MSAENCLGIYMDHANAHLMAFTTDPITTTTISLALDHEDKEATLTKSEHLMHNKENHDQLAYYKQLGAAIEPYTEVVLFGPTEAKTELFNLLRADHHFDNITLDIEPTDKLTENQQHAFVKHHFSRLN